MNSVVYRIVEHDGGWAYKLGDVFSETFPNRQEAEAAAQRVAEEQRTPGEDESISWEDEAGVWHDEAARGTDRPMATVAQAEPSRPAALPADTTDFEAAASGVGDHVFAAYDRGDQYARYGVHLARDQVRSDPLVMMLLAALCGLIAGLLLHRKA